MTILTVLAIILWGATRRGPEESEKPLPVVAEKQAAFLQPNHTPDADLEEFKRVIAALRMDACTIRGIHPCYRDDD
jgi:hypothetical protein